MLRWNSSVLTGDAKNTDIWYNTGSCTLFYYVIFRQERFIDSIETKRTDKGTIFSSLCVHYLCLQMKQLFEGHT